MNGFSRLRVVGESMSPTVRDGAIVYTRPYFFWESIQIGDVVILRDPRRPSRKIIKRVVTYIGSDYTVLGDNTHASTDSRVFGNIPRAVILGKVMALFSTI